MTLKSGVMADKIQCCVTEINYIIKCIKQKKYYFNVFLIKYCRYSLDEPKKQIKKSY